MVSSISRHHNHLELRKIQTAGPWPEFLIPGAIPVNFHFCKFTGDVRSLLVCEARLRTTALELAVLITMQQILLATEVHVFCGFLKIPLANHLQKLFKTFPRISAFGDFTIVLS